MRVTLVAHAITRPSSTSDATNFWLQKRPLPAPSHVNKLKYPKALLIMPGPVQNSNIPLYVHIHTPSPPPKLSLPRSLPMNFATNWPPQLLHDCTERQGSAAKAPSGSEKRQDCQE